MPYNLQQDSISWALSHIIRHGDTDIFPVPLEYEYYNKIKDEVVQRISAVDLAVHKISGLIKMFGPKNTGGYRAISQLDPIDCLLLTAFVGEEAACIESARMPVGDRRACAYRIKRCSNGDLFDPTLGWKDYQDKSKAVIKAKKTSYIVLADIADFYNQVSHHRLENELISAGIDRDNAREIERVLSEINGGQHSRGIPIGPSSSVVFAEICMADVDKYLLSRGYDFVRYVDDFRIFCRSEEEALRALYDLTEYLHVAHRLTLQGHKTGIIDVRTFCKDLIEPEELEEEKLVEAINEILEEKYDPYDESSIELNDDDNQEALTSAISDLFELVNNNEPLNIGLARYVLRRSANKRIRSIYSPLLAKLEYFMPIFKDVYSYIMKIHNAKYDKLLRNAIFRILVSPTMKHVSFARYWMYELISRNSGLFKPSDIIPRIESEGVNILKTRYRPIFAKAFGDIEWIRSQRETWQNQSLWAQRAFISAITILPSDEKKHWLASITRYTELSISLMAIAAKQQLSLSK